ncbi:hypothetical protein ACFE04_023484 [Oxalis oulophora]
MDDDVIHHSWVFVEKPKEAEEESDIHGSPRKLKTKPSIKECEQTLHDDFSSSDVEKHSDSDEPNSDTEVEEDYLLDIEETEDYFYGMDFVVDNYDRAIAKYELLRKFTSEQPSSPKRTLLVSDDQQFPKHIIRKGEMKIGDVVMANALYFLPAKSLCRCKAVSKRWNDWISRPFFAHRQLMEFKDFSGLFCQLPGGLSKFIPKSAAYGVPKPSLSFLPETVTIKSSCNGLICCKSVFQDDYYICNPATEKWTKIPRPGLYHGPEVAVGLVFVPDTFSFKSNFEIVCVVNLPDDRMINFEIFSSRSGEWRVAESICCELREDVKLKPVGFYHSWKLYWETVDGYILVFDLKDELYGGILQLPPASNPNGVLTQMNGEICYLLPRAEGNGYWTIEVYGDMDMKLKQEISVHFGEISVQFGPFKAKSDCRVLAYVDDGTLIISIGDNVEAYCIKQQRMTYLGKEASLFGNATYLPYINTLAEVFPEVEKSE